MTLRVKVKREALISNIQDYIANQKATLKVYNEDKKAFQKVQAKLHRLLKSKGTLEGTGTDWYGGYKGVLVLKKNEVEALLTPEELKTWKMPTVYPEVIKENIRVAEADLAVLNMVEDSAIALTNASNYMRYIIA